MNWFAFVLGILMLLTSLIFAYFALFTKQNKTIVLLEVMLWLLIIVVIVDSGLSSDLLNPHNWMVMAVVIATIGRLVAIIKNELRR